MSFGGVLVGFRRVPVGFFGVLMGGVVVALLVVFGCGAMGLGGVLVVLCCLMVRFVCHVCVSCWVSPKQLEPMLGRALFHRYHETVN
jgi:hypothetical protein